MEIPTGDWSHIDAEAMRFEREYKADRRPRIEDFLAGEEESHRAALLKELLRVECELRRQAGENPDAEEYRRRFPDHAKVVDSAIRPTSAGSRGPAPTEPLVSDAGSDAIPPELVGHPDYKVVQPLGGGGMGLVYLAHNRIMDREEVLKVISREIIELPGVLDRFVREIRAVAGLEHPNIVTAYSAFRAAGSLVLAMEYVEGLDLSRVVKAKGPLPVANACAYVQQAALGLQHAHERGLVHRDIKPGNLMLTREGRQPLVKVLDFGLAKAGREQGIIEFAPPAEGDGSSAKPGTTRTGQMLGTPDFIAPEQIADAQGADIRADIYSLGCTLYYLLAGRPPFRGATLYDVLQAHRSLAAPLLNLVRREVPMELAALVAKMMAKEPRRRFEMPAEVAAALATFSKKRAAGLDPPSCEISRPSPSTVPGAADGRPRAPTSPLAASSPAPAAVPAPPEALLANLIHIDETDDYDAAGAAAPLRDRLRRPSPASVGMTVLAALLLGFVVFANKRWLLGEAPRRSPHGPGISAPKAIPDEVENAGGDPPADDNGRALKPPNKPGGATPPIESSTQTVSSPKPSPPVTKTPRWDWIHDAPLPEFLRWVEAQRRLGYRPVFVNAHDPASRLPAQDLTGLPGPIRIAAIAVKADPAIPFEVVNAGSRAQHRASSLKLAKGGYREVNQTTYNDGESPHFLTIYVPGQSNGFFDCQGDELPARFTRGRNREGWRPFSVATRPAGDSWRATFLTTTDRSQAWKFSSDLDSAELNKTLDQAKEAGLRPECLFVCPSESIVRFGVVFTRDDAGLQWQVQVDLTSQALESAIASMSDQGYVPDQVVGYGASGASSYLACWKRDPRWSPATGTYESSLGLGPIDEAIEQFLIDRRIPWCAFAAFRNGDRVLSRSFGHADRDGLRPMTPWTIVDLGGLSVLFEAAAVHALVRQGRLHEDALLSRILRAEKDGGQGGSSTAVPGSGPPPLTLGRLLACLGPSGARLGEEDRKALSLMLERSVPTPTDQVPAGTLELEDAALGRVLEAATGQPATKAIVAEVVQPDGIQGVYVYPAGGPSGRDLGLINLAAPAREVGRFFLKHQLDGRPIAPAQRPAEGALLGRRGKSLGLVRRRGEWLFVVLLKLQDVAPPELGVELRICLDHAVDSLSPSSSSTGKRRAPSRGKGGVR